MQRLCAPPRVGTATCTDAGCDPDKQTNEDTCLVASLGVGELALVCDGMGGHQQGQWASTTAAEEVRRYLAGLPGCPDPSRALHEAISLANARLFASTGSLAPSDRPGTTCVALLIHSTGYVVAHAGDSRAYRYRGGKVQQLTLDHSVVRQMIEAGMISADQASQHPSAHQITRALGVAAEITPDVKVGFDTCPRDIFLLCSDGLTDLVSESDFTKILSTHQTLSEAAQALVDLAKYRGGHDNVTVVLMEVEPGAKVAGERLRGSPAETDRPTLVDATRLDDSFADPAPHTERMASHTVPISTCSGPTTPSTQPTPPESGRPAPPSGPRLTAANRRQLRRLGLFLGVLILVAITLICLRQCTHHRHISSSRGFPFSGGSVTS